MTSVVGDKLPSSKALRTSSELNGRIVAARKAERKRPAYPRSEKCSTVERSSQARRQDSEPAHRYARQLALARYWNLKRATLRILAPHPNPHPTLPCWTKRCAPWDA